MISFLWYFVRIYIQYFIEAWKQMGGIQKKALVSWSDKGTNAFYFTVMYGKSAFRVWFEAGFV